MYTKTELESFVSAVAAAGCDSETVLRFAEAVDNLDNSEVVYCGVECGSDYNSAVIAELVSLAQEV